MTEPRDLSLFGLHVIVDDAQGHLIVQGDGLGWDMLQRIKNAVWGNEARAIEVYPRASELVNNAPCRHLWRLGQTDFSPDLLGRETFDLHGDPADSLLRRFRNAWAEAGHG